WPRERNELAGRPRSGGNVGGKCHGRRSGGNRETETAMGGRPCGADAWRAGGGVDDVYHQGAPAAGAAEATAAAAARPRRAAPAASPTTAAPATASGW